MRPEEKQEKDTSEHCGSEIFLLNSVLVWALGHWGLAKDRWNVQKLPLPGCNISPETDPVLPLSCVLIQQGKIDSSRTQRDVGGLETAWHGCWKKSGVSLGDRGRRGGSWRYHPRCRSCLVLLKVMKMAAFYPMLLPSPAFLGTESCRIPPR